MGAAIGKFEIESSHWSNVRGETVTNLAPTVIGCGIWRRPSSWNEGERKIILGTYIHSVVDLLRLPRWRGTRRTFLLRAMEISGSDLRVPMASLSTTKSVFSTPPSFQLPLHQIKSINLLSYFIHFTLWFQGWRYIDSL